MNKFVLFFVVFFIGCSSSQKVDLDSSVDRVYITSGVEQYFLANLPYWANFSSAGQCHRNKTIQFFNFINMKRSFNLTYNQMVHLQHMYNRKIYVSDSFKGEAQRSPKDASFVFNNVYQKVISGSFDFKLPAYNKVSVVWIDPLLGNPKKIKRLFHRKDLLSGHPIILSYCLTSLEIDKLIQELKLDSLGIKSIPAEMLNIYSKENQKQRQFSVHLNEILKDKKITVFSTKKESGIAGAYKFIKIQ